MSVPIITGANIFRAKTVLTAAQIRALDITPVLLVPATAGKKNIALLVISNFVYGTTTWTVATGAEASLMFGPTVNNVAYGNVDVVSFFLNGNGLGQFGYNGATQVVSDATPLDPRIFLVATTPGFNTGSALSAAVDPANKGLLYAGGDTGTIQVTDAATDPTYTVTGTGAGGLVTTVTVAAGTGVQVGGPFATTVTTGSGDGNLKLSITAITPLGDGTLELDVLYQPI